MAITRIYWKSSCKPMPANGLNDYSFAFLLHFLERLNSCDSIEKKITESLTDICEYYGFKRGFIYQTDGFRYFYLKETVGNNDNVLRQRFEISEMTNQHVVLHCNIFYG